MFKMKGFAIFKESSRAAHYLSKMLLECLGERTEAGIIPLVTAVKIASECA